MSATVLGDIVERKPGSSAPKNTIFPGSSFVDVPSTTGFPKAHHRSQGLSAFAARRARANEERTQSSGSVPSVRASSIKDGNGKVETREPATQNVTPTDARKQREKEGSMEKELSKNLTGPVEQRAVRKPTALMTTRTTEGHDELEWRRNMERENDALVENMDDNQRSQEQEELVEQLGPDVLDLIGRIQGRRASAGKGLERMSDTAGSSRPRSAMSHHSRTGTDESTPANKALRKLRFSERPDEVFVYESAPSSPKRILALLPAPSSFSTKDKPVEPSPEVPNLDAAEVMADKPPSSKDAQDRRQEDEHTPEEIREKYFPSEPPASQNPTLVWLTKSDKPDDSPVQSSTSTRYDLRGRVIPRRLISTLPSHLGLHHHGNDPEEAGYTLDELLMLSRSTLPAQRAATLQVLARLLSRIQRNTMDSSDVKDADSEVEDEEEKAKAKAVADIIQKCLIVGIEAFGERASATVRMAGLDVIWAGIVHDQNPATKPKLAISEDQAQLETLPLSYFYSATLFNFTRTNLNPPSMVKLFQVLISLVTSSLKVAEELVEVPGLLDGAVRSVSSSGASGPSIDPSQVPAYLALSDFMKALTSVSRKCARALIPGISDSFLRYIITLPSLEQISATPSVLNAISGILELYTLLGRYGLGASIASTGHEYFQRLAVFATQNLPLDAPEGRMLTTSWLALIETWIVCAIDPHQTSPGHDILWSQVVAWQWSEALLSLRERLLEMDGERMGDIWVGWWRVWAAWLQGCRVNEVNQGEVELDKWREKMKESWADGGKEHGMVQRVSSLLQSRDLLQIPEQSLLNAVRILHGALLLIEAQGTPALPSSIPASGIVDNVTSEANWGHISSSYGPNHLRVWTNMLTYLVRASNQSGSPIGLHYRVINLLVPGDEILASRLISDILADTLRPVNPEGLDLPEDFWTAAGGPAKILLPLYQYALWPQEDLFIGPLVPHSPALTMTTTLSSPPSSLGITTPSGGTVGIRLPQENLGDWIISALDILLRSGSTHSRLFRSLPADWTASEAEVVRSLMMLILRRQVPLSRSQLLFTCMKVFMLEHGQATLENGEEVYQNPTVGRLMLKVLEPLRLSSDASHPWVSRRNPPLDAVAKSFLGPEQPFYQFYSDFLGLYDSSSFGHRLFGTLTLPPTSQVYPKDYRKLLWGDYAHTLRSIQAEVSEVFATEDDMKHWLWPVEGRRDGEMLGLYVKALVKGNVTGFLRSIAIHQVASCLWPDLMQDNEGVSAPKLLRAILTISDESLLREILYYQQSKEGVIPVVPPHCYEPLPALAARRLDWAVSTAGESVRNRFPSA